MLPLLTFTDRNTVLVWSNGRGITHAEFARDARRLAQRWPAGTHAINLCSGRLHFMLALAASALRGQTTLLPPNQAPAALEQLQQLYRSHHVVNDESVAALLSATEHDAVVAGDDVDTLPIPGDDTFITLFTSGSSGAPQAQDKTWANLSVTAQLDAQRFAPKPINLVATVPSQHMFGLQTTVLLPLRGGCAIHDSRPFFPADIRAALEAVPEPRGLIITPTHLRACLTANIQLPQLEFILSATAPMPSEMVRPVEKRWLTQLVEIYGSTEAGTMGTRRSIAGERWQPVPTTRMESVADGTLLHAPHLPQPVLLSDHVEILADGQFRLLGRATDQIKIAGKRASLNELSQALLKIPGVQDGALFVPPQAERTAALVVAPQLTAAQLLDALAREVDPVFLPRPLLLVERLPRNEVGKLTQAALMDVLQLHGFASR